jgi:hypothetical protein
LKKSIIAKIYNPMSASVQIPNNITASALLSFPNPIIVRITAVQNDAFSSVNVVEVE